MKLCTKPTVTEIVIERGALKKLGARLSRFPVSRRCMVLTDTRLPTVVRQSAVTSLRRRGYQVFTHSFLADERHKTLTTVKSIYDVFWQYRLERRDTVVALGGGVLGDTVGLAAATYLRGLPFVQCPTTLLAMVDSSIGGKAGVNLVQGKNLIGSFYAPLAVVIDPTLLRTLPLHERRNGLAECIKHAIIEGPSAVALLMAQAKALNQGDETAATALIRRNVAFKTKITESDPWERGVRALLNLGHTFAHAIETTVGYGAMPHGQAVALGLVAAADISMATRRCRPDTVKKITQLLELYGLPTRAPLPSVTSLLKAMRGDKKTTNGNISLILIRDFGVVEVVESVPRGVVRAAWLRLGATHL